MRRARAPCLDGAPLLGSMRIPRDPRSDGGNPRLAPLAKVNRLEPTTKHARLNCDCWPPSTRDKTGLLPRASPRPTPAADSRARETEWRPLDPLRETTGTYLYQLGPRERTASDSSRTRATGSGQTAVPPWQPAPTEPTTRARKTPPLRPLVSSTRDWLKPDCYPCSPLGDPRLMS